MRTNKPLAAAAAVILAGGFLMATNPATSETPNKDAASAGGDTLQRSGRQPTESKPKKQLEQITFGSGCFWCTEAVFAELAGVESAVSGYSGGFVPNPTYDQVCTGATGHAEVVQVTYDPALITIPELLEVFWMTHDPTTLNQQGADYGSQYRSTIFYFDEEQKAIAERIELVMKSVKSAANS